MNKIKKYVEELRLIGYITDEQARFFLGWCQEGGNEFIKTLEEIIEEAEIANSM